MLILSEGKILHKLNQRDADSSHTITAAPWFVRKTYRTPASPGKMRPGRAGTGASPRLQQI